MVAQLRVLVRRFRIFSRDDSDPGTESVRQLALILRALIGLLLCLRVVVVHSVEVLDFVAAEFL